MLGGVSWYLVAYRRSDLITGTDPSYELSLGEPQLQCRGFLGFVATHPVVGEAVDLDDLPHRFKGVGVMAIPGASVVAWGMARSCCEADVAAHLVEIRTDAA